MSPIVIALMAGLSIGLIFVLMALPMGIRTVSGSVRIAAGRDEVWQALYPLGGQAGWSREILQADPAGVADTARLRLFWTGRDGAPIERVVALEDVREPAGFVTRVLDDSSLDPLFWNKFAERVSIRSAGDDVVVRIEQTDRYIAGVVDDDEMRGRGL